LAKKLSMIRTFNNFAPAALTDLVEQICKDTNFPYTIGTESFGTVTYDPSSLMEKDYRVVDCQQFVHILAHNGIPYSPYFHLFSNLIECVIEKYFPEETDLGIIRSKVNIQPQQKIVDKDVFFNPPHIDPGGIGTIVALYYVEDSDGDTFFFKKNGEISRRISPQKGKLVLFDGSIYHASSPPQDHKSRIVINTNIDKSPDILKIR
jgi:hypothetical protein